MSNETVKPEVGMGATYYSGTDRYAQTIIKVSKGGKLITIQSDVAIRIDKNGMSERQTYRFEPNPTTDGGIRKASLRKDGTWRIVGQQYGYVKIGYRDHYRDFSF